MQITLNAPGSAGLKLSAAPGENLLKTLQNAGVYVPAPCGGRGSCGKCAVKVRGGLPPVSAADRRCFSPEELKAGWRLACALHVNNDITVQLSGSGEERFCSLDTFTLGGGESGNAPPEYSVAIDIGTTTLGFALLDTRNKAIAGRFTTVNKQREHGGDVISRIQYANGGGLAALRESIRGQIAAGIAALCGAANAAAGEIRRIAIAGNTTMLHLLQGFSCQTLGTAPFTPVTLELTATTYRQLFDGGLSAEVIILPGISTYVGADIAAGILYTGLHRGGQTSALMDIGTNGEIALAHEGEIICTATAAGPAFEGGNIRWGTGSVPGAISRARFCGGVFEVGTIGGGQPQGICGSGVVDIVCQGLQHGLILPSGRFSGAVPPEGIALAKNSEGRSIALCQQDVRELQLAKSAIRTGFDALLNHAGIDYDSLDRLYIAGGFGYSLNRESAAGIGLLPPALLPKVTLAGNSSLGGAALYLLDPDGSAPAMREIVRRSTEFNLPTDDFFNEQFIANINFETGERP